MSVPHGRVLELHPLVQDTLQSNREQSRFLVSKGKDPNFDGGYFVLVARDEFHAGKKLSLRWRGPRRVIRAVSDFVNQVEDLRNGTAEYYHTTRSKFYHDKDLDKEAILSHAFTSETGMQVQHLLKIVDTADGLFVQERCSGLTNSEDTRVTLAQVYKVVPKMLESVSLRKNLPQAVSDKARVCESEVLELSKILI